MPVSEECPHEVEVVLWSQALEKVAKQWRPPVWRDVGQRVNKHSQELDNSVLCGLWGGSGLGLARCLWVGLGCCKQVAHLRDK